MSVYATHEAKIARIPADSAARAATDAVEDDAGVVRLIHERVARLVQPHVVPPQRVPAR